MFGKAHDAKHVYLVWLVYRVLQSTEADTFFIVLHFGCFSRADVCLLLPSIPTVCLDNQFRMSILERLEQMERRMAEMASHQQPSSAGSGGAGGGGGGGSGGGAGGGTNSQSQVRRADRTQ